MWSKEVKLNEILRVKPWAYRISALKRKDTQDLICSLSTIWGPARRWSSVSQEGNFYKKLHPVGALIVAFWASKTGRK